MFEKKIQGTVRTTHQSDSLSTDMPMCLNFPWKSLVIYLPQEVGKQTIKRWTSITPSSRKLAPNLREAYSSLLWLYHLHTHNQAVTGKLPLGLWGHESPFNGSTLEPTADPAGFWKSLPLP